MRLLFSSKHFILGKYGNPSKRRRSLSEKSIVSNWSNVAPIFSICGILYPEKIIKISILIVIFKFISFFNIQNENGLFLETNKEYLFPSHKKHNLHFDVQKGIRINCEFFLPRRSSSRSRHGFMYCIDEFINSGVSLTILCYKLKEYCFRLKMTKNKRRFSYTKNRIEVNCGAMKLELFNWSQNK